MNRVGEELAIGACSCIARVGHIHAYNIGPREYVVTEGEFGTIASVHSNATDARLAAAELNEETIQ